MTSNCPIEYTLSIIKSKWTILIIRDLSNGKKRFSELKKTLPDVSQKVLTANLRFLEEKDILTRTVFPVVPPHVEYELTELGMSLKPILNALRDWGNATNKK